ncbi:PREDICTED: replication protein A 70 kDa DNA-binding subunit E-like, partial [Erythranthe guttata]|uniref:replication protein A 70 kDa DNA-binding subunit E-like n=1 Tax=Erythranthe guttata TaxID=4155 RepID=UPI00064DFF86
MDEQGDEVQATVHYKLVFKYDNKIRANKCYLLNNLNVGAGFKTYKHTLSDYRINFDSRTTFKQINMPSIPSSAFKFVTFPKIIEVSNNNERLIDIIGYIVGKGEIEPFLTKEGVQKKKLLIELQDLELDACCAWEKYAEQVIETVLDINEGPYIAVLQYATAQMRYGDIEVSNTLHSSRFMINANIDEINDYKSRLTQSEPDSCRVVSQMSSNTSYSYEDDFVHKSIRKTLDDLNESPE